MSLVAKLKELEAAMAERDARIAALTSEHDANTAKLTKDFETKLAEANTNTDGLKAKLAAGEQTITDLRASLESVTKERDAEKARADTAEQRLANPAFDDAKAGTGQKPVNDGGDASAAIETDEKFFERYAAESDPQKRSAMYREHLEKTGRKSA